MQFLGWRCYSGWAIQLLARPFAAGFQAIRNSCNLRVFLVVLIIGAATSVPAALLQRDCATKDHDCRCCRDSKRSLLIGILVARSGFFFFFEGTHGHFVWMEISRRDGRLLDVRLARGKNAAIISSPAGAKPMSSTRFNSTNLTTKSCRPAAEPSRRHDWGRVGTQRRLACTTCPGVARTSRSQAFVTPLCGRRLAGSRLKRPK